MKIYLAIPYSGQEEVSFAVANRIAAKLMEQDHVVFSPISHSHSISRLCDLPTSWEFWKKQDLPFIDWCDAIVVIVTDLKSVLLSTGVIEEVKYAQATGKKILFYNLENEKLEEDFYYSFSKKL